MKKILALIYGLLTLFLFFLAVGLMNYQLFYGLNRGLLRLEQPINYYWDIFLIIQFPVLHSLLLTKVKNKLYLFNSELGKQLSTTTYVMIASTQLILVFLFWAPLASENLIYSDLLFLTQKICFFLSNIFLAKSMYDAGLGVQLGIAGWWSLFRDIPIKYPKMPEDGCFKICRQPIYLSFTLLLWSAPTNNLDKFLLASFWSIYCIVGPLFKEVRFKKYYGDKFLAYQKKTSYFLPFKF